MPRFAAIEGLRAWLAWAVVFSHIAQSLGVEMFGGPMMWFGHLGEAGVMTFIAISGFVITGLVVDKQEPWPRYILRRAFRIFPAYWVAYAGALLALPLAIAALANLPWVADPRFAYDELLHEWSKTMGEHPWQQLALHFTLFQGVVPDGLWLYTSSAVLGPAWSLSLEWQFYLVAPAFVWLVAKDRYRMATTLVISALAVAFHFELFGWYEMPSFLPGAAYVFLLGIACRLNFDRLKSMAIGPEVIPVMFAVAILAPQLLWLAIWLSAFAYLARREAWAATASGRPVVKALDAMLASRVAGYFGARSYGVYLVHFPIIMAVSLPVLSWARSMGQFNQLEAFLLLAAIVIPLTLLASELLYRLVERPFIALGTRLARPRRPAMAPAE